MTDSHSSRLHNPGRGSKSASFLASDNLLARIGMLAFLTLVLLIPLGMIGGVIADRAYVRGRGDEERQRGVGRPADLRRPDDRGALSPVTPTVGDELPADAAARKLAIDGNIAAAAAAARSVHRQRL